MLQYPIPSDPFRIPSFIGPCSQHTERDIALLREDYNNYVYDDLNPHYDPFHDLSF